MVRGCEFQRDRPQITLGPEVRSGVIVGNVFRGPAQITNQSPCGYPDLGEQRNHVVRRNREAIHRDRGQVPPSGLFDLAPLQPFGR